MATTARDAMTSNCTLPDQLQSIYPNRVQQRPRASTNRTRHVSDEIENVLLYVVPQDRDTYFVVILGPRPAIRNVHQCCIVPMLPRLRRYTMNLGTHGNGRHRLTSVDLHVTGSKVTLSETCQVYRIGNFRLNIL